MQHIHLNVIPGDGIGAEVVAAAKRILEQIENLHGDIRFSYTFLDWGCEYYLRTGRMMPEDGLSRLRDCDSILFGAVGFPGVPDHISLRGLLLPIRFGFDQYINLRPIRMLDGMPSPLKIERAEDIDFVVIRENSEGEYCGKGRYVNEGTEKEAAVQEAWFSRKGTSRVIRYAFDLALKAGRKEVISATKSNSFNYSMVFWDKIFNEVKTDYPEIETRSILIDALAGLFVMQPQSLDVVVASNLFGDILTDLGSAMLGSIGISPSANINPERIYPSMFEPIHGSAPDIAGKGLANPIGMIWALVLMLEHLGFEEMGSLLFNAMSRTIRERTVTPDIGGTYTTEETVQAICAHLE